MIQMTYNPKLQADMGGTWVALYRCDVCGALLDERSWAIAVWRVNDPTVHTVCKGACARRLTAGWDDVRWEELSSHVRHLAFNTRRPTR